jgi:hypothetical protein
MSPEDFLTAIANGEVDSVAQALATDPTLGSARHGSGASAIQWAIYNGQREIADRIFATVETVDLWTACAYGGNLPPFEDANALSPDGFTPLSLAVAFGNNAAATALLQNGADPDLRGTALGGIAPIHAAVFGRNQAGVAILIAHGADVKAKQTGGFTALHGAAQNGDQTSVELLLNAGAERMVQTDDGKLAADFASDATIIAILTR